MAVETRIMNCITCPMGCELTVTITDGVVTEVKGNTCPRGKLYAINEVTAPKRMLTYSVSIEGALLPLLPVVSSAPLPKDKVLACARELRKVKAVAPITVGDVVCADILGLKVDIVASRSMTRK